MQLNLLALSRLHICCAVTRAPLFRQAYESAIELDASRLYSLLRAGGLQLALGATDEAAAHFEAALNLDADHPAASLGMAKTLLAAARAATAMHAPGELFHPALLQTARGGNTGGNDDLYRHWS